MRQFGFSVRVDLHKPTHSADGHGEGTSWPSRMVGYYQNFCVTAQSEAEAREFVSRDVGDGEIRWEDSTIYLDVMDRIPLSVIERSGNWAEAGIWFKSGRDYFPGE